jgi:hypothetical protein
MNKIQLYFLNMSVASWHLLLSIFGLYYSRKRYGYFFNLAVTADEFLNAFFFGDPLETISSRAGKARNNKEEWGCMLCLFLAVITNHDHCTAAIRNNKPD